MARLPVQTPYNSFQMPKLLKRYCKRHPQNEFASMNKRFSSNRPLRQSLVTAFHLLLFTLLLAPPLFAEEVPHDPPLVAEEAPEEPPKGSRFNRYALTILGGSGTRTSRVDSDVQRLSRDLFLRDVLLDQFNPDPLETLLVYKELKNRPDYSLDAASFAFTAYMENSGLGFGIGIDHYHNQRYGPIPGYIKIVESTGLPATILRFNGLQPFCTASLMPFCRARETYQASAQTIPYFAFEYRYQPVPFFAMGLGLGIVPFENRYSQFYAYFDVKIWKHLSLEIRARSISIDGEKRYPQITSTRRADSTITVYQLGLRSNL